MLKRVARLQRGHGCSPAAFGRLCVETTVFVMGMLSALIPAAFGRLCVETRRKLSITMAQKPQPPSGGCVLKHDGNGTTELGTIQPPSGGCVLKLEIL